MTYPIIPPAVPSVDPELRAMLRRFPESALSRAVLERVDEGSMPEAYRRLLGHRHHMTVALEERHGAPVELEVLERRLAGSEYSRRLVLRCGPPARVVLKGMMSLQLERLGEEVRRRVLEEREPLGRILIEARVLRWIHPHAYFRVRLNDELRRILEAPGAVETYGRLAFILCHNLPAVELLEVVSPERNGTGASRPR
ncbi:MAG: hypothetical protein HY721_19000 [Planctomycetes bacterium]|nr:hypothetical protein [Planctomycetota bacterium]